MEKFIGWAIALGAPYLIYKFAISWFQIRQIRKIEQEADNKRDAIYSILNKDLENCRETFANYDDPKSVTRIFKTKEEALESLKDAEAEIEKEKGIYLKYVRAKERCALDSKKQNLPLLCYHQYLHTRHWFLREKEMLPAYLEHDIKSLDEIQLEGQEYRVRLEEAERRLDDLAP